MQKRAVARRVELDEGHSATRFLLDLDCLVGGEEVADFGFLK